MLNGSTQSRYHWCQYSPEEEEGGGGGGREGEGGGEEKEQEEEEEEEKKKKMVIIIIPLGGIHQDDLPSPLPSSAALEEERGKEDLGQTSSHCCSL